MTKRRQLAGSGDRNLDGPPQGITKKRTIVAVFWSSCDAFTRIGLQFIVSIILARILTPNEFGTIALLSMFVGIANVFVDGGFTSALIQSQNHSYDDECTVFWFNMLVGVSAAALLILSAPTIAIFYSIPVLIPLTQLVAASVALSGLSALHVTLLKKKLDFRRLMVIGGVASLVSGTAAVYLAVRGYGVWALAAQTVVASIVTTLMAWLMHPWRPSFLFRRASIVRLFGFGGYMLAARLLDVANQRLYTMTIGRFHGPAELGIYLRAENTRQMPVGLFTGILSSVAYPAFANIAGDREKLKQAVRLCVRSIMFINVPLMLGLALASAPVIELLFGPKWRSSAPLLQILCLAGILWPLQVISDSAILAVGRSRTYLKAGTVKKVIGLGMVICASYYSVTLIAYTQAVLSIVYFVITARINQNVLGYSVRDQVMDFRGVLVVGSAVSAMMYYLQSKIAMHLGPELFMLAIGALVYACLCLTLKLVRLSELEGLFRRPNRVNSA
ncbi:lipopolysaccharide biosynthesis protein [Mesorhizobium sp. M0923]|uniref:lipopolysaccharide biosynthesis protein n=1 Tax=Mesorhizobium sp. M0923 TaxID=2957028 RepID=UPI00333708A6